MFNKNVCCEDCILSGRLNIQATFVLMSQTITIVLYYKTEKHCLQAIAENLEKCDFT